MYIVHIATELAPVAKVGGLGDVLYGLSKELVRQGHTVEVILPKYDCLRYEQLQNLKVEHRELWVGEGTQRYNNTLWSAQLDGLHVLLIEPHHPQYYFSRGVIYGCHDDIDRFLYFSKVAVEYMIKTGRQPEALHVHDWPTAIVPLLYQELHATSPGGTLLTIHNMEHQGKCQVQNLSRIGLRGDHYLFPEKMQDPFSPQLINLLKGGIVYADKITTVSPNYEKEIQTVDGGFGLQDVLKKNAHKLKGVLNGIDEDFWNPEKDLHLVAQYPAHGITKEKLALVRKGKKANRTHLEAHFRLKPSESPLVASITRLVPQKSPELIKHALFKTLEKGGQFILLGSTPIPQMQKEFEMLKEAHKENGNIAISLDYDEALAHLIFAASDLLIVPSLFEPCGLTQLIALRYGTIPIARMTGGLADTVFDIDTSTRPHAERNGFTFDFPDQKGVDWALLRALESFTHDRGKWETLMLNGMRHDFSWKTSAADYIHLYKSLKAFPKG